MGTQHQFRGDSVSAGEDEKVLGEGGGGCTVM